MFVKYAKNVQNFGVIAISTEYTTESLHPVVSMRPLFGLKRKHCWILRNL